MRPLITWLAILGYSLVALGLPLPLSGGDVASDPVVRQLLAAKDRSVRFPCMDKPCGCASARQCFRDCCCTTPAERLAWARRNGLEVEVLLALESRSSADRPADSGESSARPAASCCSAKPPREVPADSCCSSDKDGAAAPGPRPFREPLCTPDGEMVVDGQDDPRGILVAAAPRVTASDTSLTPVPDAALDPSRDPPPPGRHPPVRQVTLRAMLACQGVVSSWITVGASLPPPRIELGALLRSSERLVILDVTAQSPPPDPVAPPPWAA